jgi:hypothetical protein
LFSSAYFERENHSNEELKFFQGFAKAGIEQEKEEG